MDIKELYEKHRNLKEVTVEGWMKSLRDSGNLMFVSLDDGTSANILQVIVKKETHGYEQFKKAKVGAAVSFKGVVALTPNREQPFEILATDAYLLNNSSEDYPLQKKEHSLEFLREIAHLRPRSNLFKNIFRIRNEISISIHAFFSELGFHYLNSPIITSNDAEGAGESFDVVAPNVKNYFGGSSSLTVSGQLNAEAFAQAFKRVYTFGPTFRAEKSSTSRHLAEFWMIEPEMAFSSLDEDIAVAEAMIKYIFENLLIECKDELLQLEKYTPGLIEKISLIKDTEKFPRVRYDNAVEKLLVAQNSGVKFEIPVQNNMDLKSEHERYLVEQIYKSPIFLTHFPKELKAFYMKLDNDNKNVLAFDLLFPGIGEIIGGSQREDNYEKLLQRVSELKIDSKPIEWYLNLRKSGYAPSAGFGLGLERLIMYVTGTDNIRDVIPFARAFGSISF